MKLYKEVPKKKPNYMAMLKRGIMCVAVVAVLSAVVVGGLYGYKKVNTKYQSTSLTVEKR